MAGVPPKYTERSAQLSQRVEATVNDLMKTNPVGLPSDWDILKKSAKRWTESFETLVEEFHLEETSAEEEPTVCSVLTSGMDETLDRLRDIKLERLTEQTPQHFERLEARIVYHTESIALISAHSKRERSKRIPNPQMELRRMDERWARQKADLEAILKKVFTCTSSDLLWRNSTTTQQTPEALPFPSWSPSSSPVCTSIPFIAKLKFEPLASFLDFPQSTYFDTLMRASVYLLNTLQISMCDVDQGAADDTKLTSVFVNFYKCAWVVHNLVKYSESMPSLGWMKQITTLILEKLTDTFVKGNQMQFPSANSINVQSCDLSVRDPLGDTPEECGHFQPISSFEPASMPAGDWYSISKSSSSPTSGSSQMHQLIQSSTTSGSQKEQPDESMSLLTAAVTEPLDQQKWIPSDVHIFKGDRNFRLCIHQKESLHLEFTVNRETDEIVPGYAFRTNSPSSRPALWFRQNVEDKVPHFSTVNIQDLIYFTDCFIGDAGLMGYFPLINEIQIQSKKGSGSLTFRDPTAQAWTAIGEEMMRGSAPSLQSAQTQRRSSVGPIGERIEESKILFFCGPSIFTMLVTNETNLKKDNATSLTIFCLAGRTAHLPMYITKGTLERPAGMPMNFSPMSRAGNSTRDIKEYSSIRLEFPNSERMQAFIDDFGECRQKWFEKAAKLKSQRDLQRSPIIESKSYFSSNLMSTFFSKTR
ncbi:uncharacterized protein K441DRAFT_662410 [Cenococcum geophilum 1.58]|uniref:uncharacterized protein n=1 Tax=Cenococcum geophilum 1.58 TaxID=794803 RepID=UPI00358ECE2E|nr:hypothetical protein K441DRAFT_662410 [Cenococcum geophilum 1.58]